VHKIKNVPYFHVFKI